ncbi:hypothetical protein Csa_014375 [Cucumis sativus]|uniref:Secreted protein n=1 Tax=Cucumis sativus TaxID=3659 RepID=A0A0A0LQI4_CUCSA|nr:hypothetical protein Csa_014375 [Cucumis sativus]
MQLGHKNLLSYILFFIFFLENHRFHCFIDFWLSRPISAPGDPSQYDDVTTTNSICSCWSYFNLIEVNFFFGSRRRKGS